MALSSVRRDLISSRPRMSVISCSVLIASAQQCPTAAPRISLAPLFQRGEFITEELGVLKTYTANNLTSVVQRSSLKRGKQGDFRFSLSASHRQFMRAFSQAAAAILRNDHRVAPLTRVFSVRRDHRWLTDKNHVLTHRRRKLFRISRMRRNDRTIIAGAASMHCKIAFGS